MTALRTTTARASAAVLALSLAGATALAGCGSSSSGGNGEANKSGPEVVKDAAAALAKTDAVHFTGDQKTSDGAVKIDMQFQSDSSAGTVEKDGDAIGLVVVGDTVYVKASAKFYESQGAAAAQAEQYGDRYVKASSTQAKSFDNFNLKGFSASLGETSTDSKVEDKVVTDELDGKDVVVVSQSDGSKMYVAASGEPLPLKLTGSTDGSASGSGTFSDYGKREDIKAPADAVDAPAG